MAKFSSLDSYVQKFRLWLLLLIKVRFETKSNVKNLIVMKKAVQITNNMKEWDFRYPNVYRNLNQENIC